MNKQQSAIISAAHREAGTDLIGNTKFGEIRPFPPW